MLNLPRFAVTVCDFGRVVKGALFRHGDRGKGDWKEEAFDFDCGAWIELNPGVTIPVTCEMQLDIESLRRAAEILYNHALLKTVPPGYVPIDRYDALRAELDLAKQKHLDDLRLLLKFKDV